jgi:hypothetical protein
MSRKSIVIGAIAATLALTVLTPTFASTRFGGYGHGHYGGYGRSDSHNYYGYNSSYRNFDSDYRNFQSNYRQGSYDSNGDRQGSYVSNRGDRQGSYDSNRGDRHESFDSNGGGGRPSADANQPQSK